MKYLSQKLILSTLFILMTLVAFAQDSASQEPTLGQKAMFYGLTIVGLLLLYLSYRQSKWGKK
ncbi:hypothetical protein [Marinoscillum sp. MHG1-6]|uniref:hypothetical protein n=1 Tax=Marinoscillum sp. MHG1-6 TaxID=2959627 RepID=UPI0021584325|nr:hypothetical protein [Marinoscillum sp. MHG1-6]